MTQPGEISKTELPHFAARRSSNAVGAVPPVPRIADAYVARAGVIMPVRREAIGHGDVLAWPALRRTAKATRFRGISTQKMRSRKPRIINYPSDVLSDRPYGFLARRKVAELR